MEEKNYKLYISYDGTRYLGWQKLGQRGSGDYLRTIQGKLETVLSRMTGEEITVHGSGRTDAGVHALEQIASFRTSFPAEPAEIRDYLNRYLPEDIAVNAVIPAPERFHARLNARGKEYRYRIRNSSVPDVFRQRFEYTVAEPLDTELMEAAAVRFLGTHDFRNVSSAKRTKKSTVRTVRAITVERHGDVVDITYVGDGFLYNMVRILTGTLIQAGRGELGPEEIPAILAGERAPGYTAPAKGLTLMRVEY